VQWLVVDAGAITSIDYSAARVVRAFCDDLSREGVRLLVVHAESSLQADLTRHRLIDVIGNDHIFDSLHEALAAVREGRVHVLASKTP
jgi:MFS superfamily sulfate permease-like transporter